MVKKKKSYGSRLRTRAGLTVRRRWTRTMMELKKPHKCPSCMTLSVRRSSAGLWSCDKCGLQFTGGAYTPDTKLGQSSTRVK